MDGTFRFRLADGDKVMSTALLLGLIWSGLWMAFLYVIMKYFPWEMLHDYPEDEKYSVGSGRLSFSEPLLRLDSFVFERRGQII